MNKQLIVLSFLLPTALGAFTLPDGTVPIAFAGATYFISDAKVIETVAKKLETEPLDIAKGSAILGGSIAVNNFFNQWNHGYKHTVKAKELSLNGLLAYALTSKKVNNLINSIPMIGKYIACQNKICTGMCKQCKFTKLSLMLASRIGINVASGNRL